jgi:hypothetical protein
MKIVIFVDSKSVLQYIDNPSMNDSEIIIKIRKDIDTISRSGITLLFQWIPSHINIHGNDMADKLANEGRLKTQFVLIEKFVSAKNFIDQQGKILIKQHHESVSKGKVWECLMNIKIDFKTRRDYVATFRRLTGHDLLYAHLERFGIKDSAICSLCDSAVQTSEHLWVCSALDDMRKVLDKLNLDDDEKYSKLYWHVRSIQ